MTDLSSPYASSGHLTHAVSMEPQFWSFDSHVNDAWVFLALIPHKNVSQYNL